MQGFIRVPKAFEDFILRCGEQIKNQSICDFCGRPVEEGKHFTSLLDPEKKFCKMECGDDFEDDLTGEHK